MCVSSPGLANKSSGDLPASLRERPYSPPHSARVLSLGSVLFPRPCPFRLPAGRCIGGPLAMQAVHPAIGKPASACSLSAYPSVCARCGDSRLFCDSHPGLGQPPPFRPHVLYTSGVFGTTSASTAFRLYDFRARSVCRLLVSYGGLVCTSALPSFPAHFCRV